MYMVHGPGRGLLGAGAMRVPARLFMNVWGDIFGLKAARGTRHTNSLWGGMECIWCTGGEYSSHPSPVRLLFSSLAVLASTPLLLFPVIAPHTLPILAVNPLTAPARVSPHPLAASCRVCSPPVASASIAASLPPLVSSTCVPSSVGPAGGSS